MFILSDSKTPSRSRSRRSAIDLEIGGRFQIAKTLTTIGRSYSRLGDQPRAMAYLEARARRPRAVRRSERPRGDACSRPRKSLIETGDLDAAHVSTVGRRGAQLGHQQDVRLRPRAHRRARASRGVRVTFAGAVRYAEEARMTAGTGTRMASFCLYATSVESVSAPRTSGEPDSAVTPGDPKPRHGVETIEGSEFGTAIRARCYEAFAGAVRRWPAIRRASHCPHPSRSPPPFATRGLQATLLEPADDSRTS